MAWKKTDDTYYGEIASVIRAKNGTNNTYQPSQMANAISALPEYVDEEAALVLIDWEGTLLRSYTRDEAMALTSLPNPSTLPNYAYADHEWLVFQEWNWSLAGIKSFCSKYGYCPLYVGAIYDTTDHLNHIDYKKGWAKYGTQGNDYLPNFASYNLSHFSLCYGYNPSFYSSNNTFQNSYTLQSLNLPTDFPLYKLNFSGSYNLEYVTLPENSTDLKNNYNFVSCYGLNSLAVSDGITRYNTYFFNSAYALRHINIPDTVTELLGSSLQNLCRILKIQIPKNVTTIGQKAIYFANSLKTILIESKPSLENVNAFSVWSTISGRIFYVPQENLSWFSTATNWADIYSRYQFVAIEDNIEYLENLGFNVDEYKEVS